MVPQVETQAAKSFSSAATTAVSVSAADRPSLALLPDFDTNWAGTSSPLITDPAAPLPDGTYSARFVAQDPAALTLEIRRFQLCSVLGDTLRSPGPATDLGVAEAADRTLVIPLDTTTRFVIIGFECDGDGTAQGNGADMAALYSALAADYADVFTTRRAPGGDPFELQKEVRATPGLAFEPTPSACDDGLSLLWRFGDAPPVLVQSPFADVTTRSALALRRRCYARRPSRSKAPSRPCSSTPATNPYHA